MDNLKNILKLGGIMDIITQSIAISQSNKYTNNKVDQLNSGLASIKNPTISNKAFTSFGDSITAQNLWQPHIVSAFNLTHTNCGIGSTKIAGTVNASLPCMWEPSRINAVKTSNPDIVTILGGANDWIGNIVVGTDAEYDKVLGAKDTTTFKGAYSHIIETLLQWKKGLTLILLTTTWGDAEALNTLSLTNRDYAKATREVAWYYGLPCIDLRGEMGLNKITYSRLLSDSVHPNSLGAKILANCVIDKMNRLPNDVIIETGSNAIYTYYYTNGIENTAWSLGVNALSGGGTGSVTKNTDNLQQQASCTGSGQSANIGYATNVKIDLSAATILKIEAEITLTGTPSSKFLVGLDPNSRTDANNYYSDLIVSASTTEKTIFSIDVSAITNSRYIKFFASAGSTSNSALIKVYRVWAEN